jgi:hypothetical protein
VPCPPICTRCWTTRLALYQGICTDVEFRRHFAEGLPKVGVDQEQIRRVVINLVDNAIEAMDRRGAIDIETEHDRTNSVVRVIVADNGPGIPPPSARSSFCRTTRPSSAAAVSVWPSSAASSPSTAAASPSPTTSPEAPASPSNSLPDALDPDR